MAPDNPATPFEEGVTAHLESELAAGAPGRAWVVDRGRRVTDFAQYAHLARVQKIIDRDATQTLAAELGRDYVTMPDFDLPADVVQFLPGTRGRVSQSEGR